MVRLDKPDTSSVVSWLMPQLRVIRLDKPDTSRVPVRLLLFMDISLILFGVSLFHVTISDVAQPAGSSLVAVRPLWSMIALITATSPSW